MIASTHGTEGVRGKEGIDACLEDKKAYDPKRAGEAQRVKDFENGLGLIKRLCSKSSAEEEEPAVLWGGDFNPRSVGMEDIETAGCAILPQGETDLKKLQQSRNVLGARGKKRRDTCHIH